MVAQAIPTVTPNKDKWIRALERAKRGGVVAYKSPPPRRLLLQQRQHSGQ
jgi:hypothetical protein